MCLEPTVAEAVEHDFSDDRSRRIARAEKQSIEGFGLGDDLHRLAPSNTQAGTRAAGGRPLVYPGSNPRPKTRAAFACLSGPRHRSPTGLAGATTPILPSTGRR